MVNFVVIGERRSGTWPLTLLLNSLTCLTCHNDVINEPQLEKRIKAHQSYFGNSELFKPYGAGLSTHKTKVPRKGEVEIDLDPSPVTYVERTLFTRPQAGETHIGVRLPFDLIARLQMTEAIENWARRKTAAIIFMDRNPFDCYVSMEMATASNRWTSHQIRQGVPVALDPAECSRWVSMQLAVRDRLLREIKESSNDVCVIQYRWLFDLPALTRILADYLVLDQKEFGSLWITPITMTPMRQRVSNLDQLLKKVNSTTREMIIQSLTEDDQWQASWAAKQKALKEKKVA